MIMQPGLEKRIVSKIMRKLKARKDCYCFKVHGGLYTADQPDIIGCLAGRGLRLGGEGAGVQTYRPPRAHVGVLEASGRHRRRRPLLGRSKGGTGTR